MSAPSERHKALVTYCAEHWCADCPMLDPELGCMDNYDTCIVSPALGELAAEGAGTTDLYWWGTTT